MRPILPTIVVALVLVSATFLLVVPTASHSLTGPAATSSGLRTAAVPTYSVQTFLGTDPILPGYRDVLYYEVLNDTNNAPIQDLSSVTVAGTYYNNAYQLLPFPGTTIDLGTAPIGSWSFIVPSNATTNPFDPPVLTIWANSTALGMNQSSHQFIEVGSLDFSQASVCDLISGCGSLTVGSPATVTVGAQVQAAFGPTGPAANETVKVLFFSTGSSPVTVPGVPTTLVTDSNGYAALTFTPNSTVFNVPGPDHVEIQVTDSVNTSLSIFTNVTFYLYNPVGTTDYAFWLNSLLYYSGATVTANWQWRGTNSTVGTINVTNYYVFDSATNNVLASGIVDSNTSTGSFSFALPTTYYGNFYVDAFAHNGSDAWTFSAGASVTQVIFALIPSEYYFNPGDTVTVAITAQGAALNGASINAIVRASNSGQTLFNGPVSGDQFQFTVPSVAPAYAYSVAAYASTPTNGTIAQANTAVQEASGFNFWAAVSTPSSYSDGSYTPGQVVQLSYKIVPYGLETSPNLAVIYVFPGDCSIGCTFSTPAIKSWMVTSASGTLSFALPQGMTNGLHMFNVFAVFVGGYGSDLLGVNINSSPSALNYELGAGSGFTVGWLILLVLIVVVGYFVFTMMRRKPKSTMMMSPSASGSASSAPEWKEPPSGGSSPPAAPPGAQ
jgi:hypothetical protein